MIIKEKPFDIEQTFECGQCFRWNKNPDGSYTGVAHGRLANIKHTERGVEIDDDSQVWNEYFDLHTDYNNIIERLSTTDIMKNAIKNGDGIRILKQDFYETVISFIISQNNNIPRIKNIVETFCQKFGAQIKSGYYTFPKAEDIAKLKKEDLAFLRAGYRDEYIIDASKKISQGEINKDIVFNGSIEDARAEISKIKGVGPKVADCILLFSAARGEVFPTDVWMKKVLTDIFGLKNLTPNKINDFAKENFGNLSGYAQQYLFYSMRQK